jgi:hypothetical protein
LVDGDGTPRPKVVQLFLLLQEFGCQMVVWSNGGDQEPSVDYAARICKELGLTATILEKGSIQPDITIDDLDIWTRISEKTLGRVNIRV